MRVNTDAEEAHVVHVRGASTLIEAETGDARLLINKAGSAATASVVFQSGFEGRAEIGLLGSDELAVKTNAGQGWLEVIRIDGANGFVGVGATPQERLHVADGQVRFGWNQISAFNSPGGAAMEVNYYGAGDRPAYFDFHACDEWTDYSSRIIRVEVVDARSGIENHGTGGIDHTSHGSGAIRFTTSSVLRRMTITPNGRVGVGTGMPTAQLHVAGTARTGSFDRASLPDAAQVGAGGLAYLDRPNAGPVWSNGAEWRRLADGGSI